ACGGLVVSPERDSGMLVAGGAVVGAGGGATVVLGAGGRCGVPLCSEMVSPSSSGDPMATATAVRKPSAAIGSRAHVQRGRRRLRRQNGTPRAFCCRLRARS